NSAHGSGDLLVDPRGDDAKDGQWLGDVLEGALAQSLEDEMLANAIGGRRPHDDLTPGGRAGQPSGDVGGRPRGRERPALAAGASELGGAEQRHAAVVSRLVLEGGGHADFIS